jgi:dephospho-CoA kinase
MSRLTVGLTGGLASGKSTVGRWLADAGHAVVDADRLVAELYGPGRAGAARVEALFGPTVIDSSGAVDHRRLGELIFGDAEARRRLEQAIHPLVREAFREIAASTDGVAVLEATLLMEAGFTQEFDLVVTVEADVEARIGRAIERGMAEKDARARIVAQGTDTLRRSGADIVLDNSGDLEALRLQTDELLQEIARRSRA